MKENVYVDFLIGICHRFY